MDLPKRTRTRAACKRCQRRKVRCDENVPSCGSCRKAGVSCVSDGKQEVHRSYIVSVESRIKWLESIVRDRCSDVDLNRGLGLQEILDEGMQTGTVDETRGDRSDNYHHESADTVQGRREDQDEASPRIIISQGDAALRAPSQTPGINDGPQQAHEIGLLSLSPGGDPRYIGPSSGYFFAKRILNSAGCRGVPRTSDTTTSGSVHLSLELLNTPAAMPPQKKSTIELTTDYFRTVHLLYPFLHEQTHIEAIDRVYASHEKNPLETFQVYMVLAIASLNLSRQCKVHLPVEGYYASAMKQMDYVCNHGSMASLQCLLLLMVYAMYNPSCNINIWNLNYQCLASVIDLGLQRDVRASSSLHISVFDQEMRTRIFWVAYTFDRTVCTMMGRPIGIRDEACDMRFPLMIPDRDLTKVGPIYQTYGESICHISYSIHLFRLAQMNSEIKYIMHSVNRDAPAYAVPAVRNISTWQQNMIESLDRWFQAIPHQPSGVGVEIVLLCKAKYHETMILLLRPSPGIPNPPDKILDECFNHSITLLREFSELYATGNLLYNRLVVHSIFLGTLVMLNCIWKLPRTAARIPVDELISQFNSSQNILSSIGEHWREATRARDCIKELSSVTIQRLLKTQLAAQAITQPVHSPMAYQSNDGQRLETGRPQQYQVSRSHGEAAPEGHVSFSTDQWPIGNTNAAFDASTSEPSNIFDDFLQGDFPGVGGRSDIDGLVWEIFNTATR
ncbi:fungal-specific transcription factor domain-containing protein [Aspergillus varians]